MVSTWNSIDPTFNVAIQDGIEEDQEFGGTRSSESLNYLGQYAKRYSIRLINPIVVYYRYYAHSKVSFENYSNMKLPRGTCKLGKDSPIGM